MRTKVIINEEIDKTTGRINFLQKQIDTGNQELQTLSARRTELQNELKTAPEGEGAATKYINARYRGSDKKKK